jgi:hypothetical protein
MRFEEVQVINWRSFEDSGPIALSRLNVFVGRNNEGKSTLLRAISAVQQGIPLSSADIRVDASRATTRIVPSNKAGSAWGDTPPNLTDVWLELYLNSDSPTPELRTVWHSDSGLGGRPISTISNQAPNNLLYVHLSLRRMAQYHSSQVTYQQATWVGPDVSNLVPKVVTVSSPVHPKYEQYVQACKDLLGFVVGHLH